MDIDFLKENGYLIKKNLLTKNFCEKCIKSLQDKKDCEVKYLPFNNIPYFYSNFKESCILNNILENEYIKYIINFVLGSNYKLLWFKVLNKVKWIGQDVEYHQELIYNKNSKIEKNDSFQLFIALDNHSIENGCLKIIPKSHYKLEKHDEFYDRFGDHKYRVNCDILDNLYEKNACINCIFEPGDCVFFYDTTIHGSSTNLSNNNRFGVAISFVKKEIDCKYRELSYKERNIKSIKYLEELLENKKNRTLNTPKIFK